MPTMAVVQKEFRKRSKRVQNMILRVVCLIALLSVFHSGFPQEPGKHQYPALPFSSDFGGPFKLTDTSGKAVTDEDFHGRYVLLFFGYTECADICVVALYTIGRALKLTEPLSDKVTPLFVNLDPAKDSFDELEQYVRNFHPRFVGLTGSERDLAMAAGAFGIRYRNVKGDDGMTTMIHSGKIFLIDPGGKVLTYLPHEASVDWMSSVIRQYIDHTLTNTG
jgi:protein SCO1/2